jgi:hypothetical protein
MSGMVKAAVLFEMAVIVAVITYFMIHGVFANPSLSVLLALTAGTALTVLVSVCAQHRVASER